MENPGIGNLKPQSRAPSDFQSDPFRLPCRSGSATRRCEPRGSFLAPGAPLAQARRRPRLYARPRLIASRNPSLPENGNPAVLLALPVYGPCTCTLGFSVLTLVVVPGTGFWTAIAEPVCAVLPESGSWVAGALCGGDRLRSGLARGRATTSTTAMRLQTTDALMSKALLNRSFHFQLPHSASPFFRFSSTAFENAIRSTGPGPP